jgi:hypothetical protein
VLLRALAKRLEDRYQSASAMAKDLQRLIGQIERLEAQQQLNQMLQQPIQPASTLPGQLNPYETREFTTDALPVVQSSIAAPPARPPIRSAAQSGDSFEQVYAAPRPGGWLRGVLAGAALLAALGGVWLARGAYQRSNAAEPTAGLPSATPVVGVIVVPTSPAAPPTARFEATALPAPATIPALPTAEMPAATAALPTPTELPVPTEPPVPPPPPAALETTPQVSQVGDAVTIVLEDTDWQGGYRRPGGQTYGGRTATWIYGSNTEYSIMRARFAIADTFAGTVTLTIEGMDSEGRLKTPIQMLVNGVEIYNGPNPLPDDDQPLETGTWASQSWFFDAALLQMGQNEISISNLAEGEFSRPPFFMLDRAEVTYSAP